MAGDGCVETLTSEALKPINEVHRFAVFTLACFGCICVSFGYAFNLISKPLQSRYSLSQRDLTTVSTVGLVFKYFMLPYGIGYDYLGPIFTACLASVFLPLGAVLLCLCFRGDIGGPQMVVRLSVFQAIFATGCVLFDTTCVVTCINYFPTKRGVVIAFLKTYVTLGSSMVACLYTAFFTTSTANYFFFLMAYALFVGVLCILFMKNPRYHMTGLELKRLNAEEQQNRSKYKAQFFRQDPTNFRFIYAFVIMIFLIIMLPVQSCVIAYMKLGYSYKLAFAILVMICCGLKLLIPLPFDVLFKRLCRKHSDRSDSEAEQGEEPIELFDDMDQHVLSLEQGKEPVLNDLTLVHSDAEAADNKKKVETEVDYIAPQYQNPFWKNVRTFHLWALLWSLFSIVGTEAVVINNANFIYGALNGKEATAEERAMLTAINGAGSSVGRLLMSAFEMWTQHRPPEKRIPLTYALFISAGTILLACVFFVSMPPSALILPFIVAAIGNGFQSAGTILVARTLFAKDPAKHYNFCFMATSLSSIALNRFLYGEWYSVQAGDSLLCLKKKCVFMPFMVMGGLACTSFLSSVYVHFHYARHCRKVLAERARIRGEEERNGTEHLASTNGSHDGNDTNMHDEDGEPHVNEGIEVQPTVPKEKAAP